MLTGFAAFVGVAFFGGSNAVAIKLGNVELAPFWGASLRFLGAGLLLLFALAFLRVSLPRGRGFAGAALFGVLNFGLGYAFVYWALQEVTAGVLQVAVALVPLLTFVLAVLQRIEPFRMVGLVGSLIAAAGIAWIFAGSVAQVSPIALAAMIAGTLCFAQAGIVVKRFPSIHPVAENAIAMCIGGGILLALSMAAGEPWVIPSATATWMSLVYLTLVGSIGLFVLYVYLLHRWTASAAAYALLVMPLVTVILAAAILGEPMTLSLGVGAIVVVAGVYLGVFVRRHGTDR